MRVWAAVDVERLRTVEDLRGRERGGIRPDEIVEDPNPLRWTSRYSSPVTTVYDAGIVDVLNEAGLVGHHL